MPVSRMKRSSLCVLMLPVMLLLSHSARAADRIVFSGGAPLYTYQPATIVPLLKEAFRRNDREFDARFYPSQRSLRSSNSGETDGELHRIYDFHKVSGNKYPNLLRIESRLMSVYMAVFSTKDIKVKDINSLQGQTILYQSGRKNLEQMLRGLKTKNVIRTAGTDKKAFTLLARGRADIVISESFLGETIISAQPSLANIREVGRLNETPIYAYIHKKHRALGTDIASTLEAMKEDGSFKKITSSVRSRLLAGQ
jgi:polar amino acid transport system substrate-binding protein